MRPDDSAADDFNRKSFYSIIVQGVMDFRGIFLDAYIGWPGKVYNARVFANSTLYAKMNSGTLIPNWTVPMEAPAVQVPLVFLGDPAYPLLSWLMKPYSGAGTLTAQKNFIIIGKTGLG